MSSAALSSSPRKYERFHGRVGDRAQRCAAQGCAEAGEFRAPAAPGAYGDCPPEWRWLCLDHVREFNTRYNFFIGMSADEINAAQTPYAGWERQTRAFASNGASPSPRWADFTDPLDAIGAGFKDSLKRRAAERAAALETPRTKALRTLELHAQADARSIRRRYAELLRRYHPDHNGGDRSHEKALQAVVAAYTLLRKQSGRA